MSSNPILSNISAISPQGNQAISAVEAFDLSDDRFAKILDEKMGTPEEEPSFKFEDAVNKLGIPFGLEIEGLDYAEMMPSESKPNLGDLIKNVVEDFAPVVGSVIDNGLSTDTVTQTANAIKTFWGTQAQNIYHTMNKDTVDDISELISKL